MHKTWLVAATVVVLSPMSGLAQKSNTQGFMANVHLNGVSITPPKQGSAKRENGSGGGGGVRAGWGFSPNFTLFGGLDIAGVKFDNDDVDYGLGHFDLVVIYNFANPNKKLIPYLEIGGTLRVIAATQKDPSTGVSTDFAQGGSGWTVGGGLNYYFSRSTALNLGLDLSGGKFEDAEVEKNTIANTGGEAGSARINIGMTFYPMKKK